MCLNPISLPTRSKYVSLKYRDRFLMQIPCGNCAECQSTMSNQWYYRAFYEWKELSYVNGAYCYFDTLTYDDDSLPYLSDFWTLLPKKDDFPCFNHLHIRNFLQNLRMRLIRLGFSKNAFRYFLSSEYGTSDSYYKNGRLVRSTHRPHYHILLFVYDNRINPLFLSRLIGDLWKYGRTDGVKYRGARYVLDRNVILSDFMVSSKLRVCRYVTKYVQKSCEFQSELDKRVEKVMWILSQYVVSDINGVSNVFLSSDDWLGSEEAHRERLRLRRYVNQFHRQSQHFGESALGDLDFRQLVEDGCLFMPDSKNLRIAVPLPTYYKRKLFYELVEFNGSRYWQLNDLGLEYNRLREKKVFDDLVSRYECICSNYRLDFDCRELVDYVLNYRGTIKADLPCSRLQDKIDCIDLYNYVCSSDKLQFREIGLSKYWLGDSQQGYNSNSILMRIPLSVFIEKYCYFDKDLELKLDIIYSKSRDMNLGKQKSFVLKQHLLQTYKLFRS